MEPLEIYKVMMMIKYPDSKYKYFLLDILDFILGL